MFGCEGCCNGSWRTFFSLFPRRFQLLAVFEHTEVQGVVGPYAPLFNDIIVDHAGNAYVTTSGTSQIVKVDADLSGARVLTDKFPADDKGYWLNGIALTQEGSQLIVVSGATRGRTPRLFAVSSATGDVRVIDIGGAAAGGIRAGLRVRYADRCARRNGLKEY